MTVLISGASRGIGAELSNVFSNQGQRVIRAYRNSTPQEDHVELDVTNDASLRSLAENLKGQPIDLLVCNAGVYLDKGHQIEGGYDHALWDQTFAVNVTGVFLTIQALMDNLKLAENAKIAIISSKMATSTQAPGGSYIYRASKAAALNLGRNLAADLMPLGISVGIYHPGWVRTEMGGSAADISVQEAASGLAARFAALSVETTGCFEAWDGSPLAY